MTHTFLRALEAPHHFAVGKTKAQRSSEISPGSHGCSGSALSSPQTKRPLSNTWEERGTWPSEGWGGGLGCACSHPDTRPGVISEAEGPSHPGLGAGLRALQGLQRLSPPRLAHVCPRSRSGGDLAAATPSSAVGLPRFRSAPGLASLLLPAAPLENCGRRTRPCSARADRPLRLWGGDPGCRRPCASAAPRSG